MVCARETLLSTDERIYILLFFPSSSSVWFVSSSFSPLFRCNLALLSPRALHTLSPPFPLVLLVFYFRRRLLSTPAPFDPSVPLHNGQRVDEQRQAKGSLGSFSPPQIIAVLFLFLTRFSTSPPPLVSSLFARRARQRASFTLVHTGQTQIQTPIQILVPALRVCPKPACERQVAHACLKQAEII